MCLTYRCLTYIREAVQRVSTKSQLHKSQIETLLNDKVRHFSHLLNDASRIFAFVFIILEYIREKNGHWHFKNSCLVLHPFRLISCYVVEVYFYLSFTPDFFLCCRSLFVPLTLSDLAFMWDSQKQSLQNPRIASSWLMRLVIFVWFASILNVLET